MDNICEYSKTCIIFRLKSFSCHNDASFCGIWKIKINSEYGKFSQKVN